MFYCTNVIGFINLFFIMFSTFLKLIKLISILIYKIEQWVTITDT